MFLNLRIDEVKRAFCFVPVADLPHTAAVRIFRSGHPDHEAEAVPAPAHVRDGVSDLQSAGKAFILARPQPLRRGCHAC